MVVAFSAALFLDRYTYCESMCGLYYIQSTFFLLPIFFLLGLPVPIALKKYSKENPEHTFKRKLFLAFGLITMVITLSCYMASSYKYASSKNITSSKTANRFAHSDALLARPF